jgi:hypothetical protein
MGRSMWWTKNTKPKPLLEIDEEQGDINAAQKIRNICSFASDSAESVASYIDRFEDKYKKYQQTRYESAKQRALETSLKMHDPDLRDSSLRDVIGLCLKANDLRTATVLMSAIQSKSVKATVLKEHPDLSSG